MVEGWETSCLDRNCQSQVGYVYDRPVSFQVQSVCVDGLSGGGVPVLNQDRMASFSRQGGNSIGQDGKCDRQAIEIQDKTVSRWAEPSSRYRVSRIGEMSNMFDILPIHCDKLGNYNRS